MNDFDSCSPISLGFDEAINNITFDGSTYYCTIKNKCEIIALNDCYKAQKKFCTRREYNCICYDWVDNCFWASSKNLNNRLFKLDCDMNEIDYIAICCMDSNGVITGVSYKCCDNTLIVSLAHAVVKVEKHSEESKLLYSGKSDCILGVLSLCPGIITIVLRDKNYYVEVFDNCYKLISCNKIGPKTAIRNLIFNPCKCAAKLPQLDILIFKKHTYPYICSCSVCFDSLGFVPCPCSYKICDCCSDKCDNGECCENHYCEDHCREDHCCEDHCCEGQCCEGHCCEDHCCEGHCCEDQCCCGKCHCNWRNVCIDVMESIALIEAALSHILNAEGEKIQKTLAETDDIDKILCVNREVNKTIVNATHLEHVLYSKLSTLADCGVCCDFCNKKCDCNNKCCDNGNNCSCNADNETL